MSAPALPSRVTRPVDVLPAATVDGVRVSAFNRAGVTPRVAVRVTPSNVALIDPVSFDTTPLVSIANET